jgi:Holliday junction resolvase RusA-like endonuclease
MNIITFTIPGEPVPLLRARVVRNKHTGFIHSFTPDKCIGHAERIRLAARDALDAIPTFRRLEGPIEIQIDFYRMRPKSAGRKQHYPTTRPDVSNYTKLVEDSLNGMVWLDDSQIVVSHTRKLFAGPDEEPRTEVRIREMERPPEPDGAQQEALFTLQQLNA